MTDPPARDAHRTAPPQIATHQDDQGFVIELEGEVDLSSAYRLEQQLAELAEKLPSRILIDLRNLDFMDSTGLALLVRAQKSADAAGYSFCLVPGRRQVHRLFELSGLTGGVTFVDRPPAR